ncbi:MAG: M24 family metallopeptidase [Trueperaceae bacterium]
MEARLAGLRARLRELGADAVLLSAPADVRWASGFTTPEDAKAVVTPDAATLITDDRYTAQAAEESAIEVLIAGGHRQLDEILGRVAGLRLAVQADHLTWKAARDIEERLGAPPLATEGLTRALRLVKSPDEIDRLREAARLTDAAFAHVLEGTLRAGVREIDVALDLERFVRQNGGEGMAFDVIVAGGHRSAMPHGVASGRVLERGDLVTLDFGARVDGYHADMTRAVGIGPVAEPLRGWFDAVLQAQEAAVAAIRPGLSGVDADQVARGRLAEAGIAELFVHSLGHGVGLQIHEGPSLSSRSTDVLAPGMLVTVEPGVYRPGVGGLRIEDLVLVTEGGHEVLSRSPKGYLEV